MIYLHEVKARLDQMLAREGRTGLARACFDFVPCAPISIWPGGPRKMSSPTETGGRTENGRAARAVRFASAARLLSYVAGAIGAGAFLLFLFQAGLFSALMPKEKLDVPVIENPDSISARTSTVTGLDRQNQPYEVTAKRGRRIR